MEGLSLPEVEHIINQNPDEMESDRVFYRSALILNILMGIYMASKSGIGFDKLTVDEITFRNGLYCIKTYTHAIPIYNEFNVLDSVESFHLFYQSVFFMDKIMMENERKYIHLNRIEKIVFGTIRKFKKHLDTMSKEDWIKLFNDAKAEFEKILVERCCPYGIDSTWFLLENLVASLESQATFEPIIVRKKCLASSLSGSSSTDNGKK
jgi:hypothetical protein